MNKLLKKMTIVLIVCASVLYLQVFESVAASGVAIVNHVTAYSIKRHGENYSLGGPVVTVADKKISGKIQILDVMVSEPNTSHAFFVWMVDAISKEPVSEIGGFRRIVFYTMGQQNLFQRCYSEDGINDFAAGYCAPGPNAFVQCEAKNAHGFSGSIDTVGKVYCSCHAGHNVCFILLSCSG